jgi:transcriptional regulator with XRE-family HTH domain
VGELLRSWRQRRRLSQLDLALEAEVSARHLSFVETGRSKPSRELTLHLAEHLDVPLRERNSLLLAAGYAPMFHETPLDTELMTPVRDALDKILNAHQPYPAVIVDRRWDLVAANQAALSVLTEGVDPVLLAPPANALRVSLHPDGLAPRIANLTEYAAHVLDRLRRQAAVAADPVLDDLHDELSDYVDITGMAADDHDAARRLFVPLRLRSADGELAFFSTLATFGTALDITVAELAIESFFPADERTAAVLRAG